MSTDVKKTRHRLNDTEKLIIVRLIGQNKETLFAKLSSTISFDDKRDCWNGIIAECKTVYGFDAGKFLFF